MRAGLRPTAATYVVTVVAVGGGGVDRSDWLIAAVMADIVRPRSSPSRATTSRPHLARRENSRENKRWCLERPDRHDNAPFCRSHLLRFDNEYL